MYEGFCAANFGAIESPCSDDPWHQEQLLSAMCLPTLTICTSPANEAVGATSNARSAIFGRRYCMNFLFAFRETGTGAKTDNSYFI